MNKFFLLVQRRRFEHLTLVKQQPEFSNQIVNIILPVDFGKTRTVDSQTAPCCCYDLILVRDFLRSAPVGLKLDFGMSSMEWSPVARMMQPSSLVGGTTPSQLCEALHMDILAINTLDQ
jgi:hypothetical protein